LRAEDKNFPDILPEKTIIHIDTKFKSSRKDYLQPCGGYLLKIVVSASNSSSVVRKSISIDITGDWYGDEDQMLRDGVGFRIL
jgi:ribosomal protein L19